MGSDTMLKLYHCADARSFRALWMLEELEVAYDLRLLPFPPRLREPEFLALNPLGTIPLLLDGETQMTESAAICEYLASTQHDGRFAVAPGETGYGAYLNSLHFGEATLTFPQTLVLRYGRMEAEERRLPQAVEDYTRWYHARLVGLAAVLANADYVAAGRFTAADISVGYALLLAERIGLSREHPPVVKAYWRRLQARPAFQRAKAAQKSREAA